MSRRQARTIGFGVQSSALTAWLASRIGVEFAIATGAAIVVLTSLTFDRETRREKRIERRADATALLLARGASGSEASAQENAATKTGGFAERLAAAQ